jgi:hypothetical protein
MKQNWMVKVLGGLIVGAGIVAGVALATVTGTYTPTRVSTDGNTTAYSFSFAVPAQGDLVVQLVNSTNTSSVTNQTLTTNYTVTLSKSTPGGHIDFLSAPAAGQYVQLSRDIAVTQPTDIPAGGLFREIQIENALDRNVLLLQQQQEQIDRAIKVPLLSNDTTDYTTIIENAAIVAAEYANASSASAALSQSYVSDASGYANDSSGYADTASGYADDALGYANVSSSHATNSSASATLAEQYANDAYENSLGNLTVANETEAQGATNDVKYMSPAKTKVLVEYAGAVLIPVANGGTNATNATQARTNLGIPTTFTDLTTNQTVAGIKTFTSIPVLPASNATTDNQAIRKAQLDSAIAALTGFVDTSTNQTINGTKTFESAPKAPYFLRTYLAGDVLLASSDALAQSAGGEGWKKVKEFTLNSGQGTLRIYFALAHTATDSDTAYATIYRNGSAVGTQRQADNNPYAGSEDIAGWSKGDLVQIYAYDNGSSARFAKVTNFRIYVDIAMTDTMATY